MRVRQCTIATFLCTHSIPLCVSRTHADSLTHIRTNSHTCSFSLCLSVSPSVSLARLYVGGGGAEGGDRDGARLRDARNVPCRTVRGPSLFALARTHTHRHAQTDTVCNARTQSSKPVSVTWHTHTHTLSLIHMPTHTYTCAIALVLPLL
jgi:hypothetical protein